MKNPLKSYESLCSHVSKMSYGWGSLNCKPQDSCVATSVFLIHSRHFCAMKDHGLEYASMKRPPSKQIMEIHWSQEHVLDFQYLGSFVADTRKDIASTACIKIQKVCSSGIFSNMDLRPGLWTSSLKNVLMAVTPGFSWFRHLRFISWVIFMASNISPIIYLAAVATGQFKLN